MLFSWLTGICWFTGLKVEKVIQQINQQTVDILRELKEVKQS